MRKEQRKDLESQRKHVRTGASNPRRGTLFRSMLRQKGFRLQCVRMLRKDWNGSEEGSGLCERSQTVHLQLNMAQN
jgi:hypothetical protein